MFAFETSTERLAPLFKNLGQHAYLISGSQVPSVKSAAQTLAMAHLCQNMSEKPCGSCAACKGIQAGEYIDYQRIVPEKGTIKKEAMDEVKKQSGQGPYQEAYLVIQISDADTMTTAAANAFLKELETPHPQTVFILSSTRPHRLLPTIISRSQHIQLPRISDSEQATFFKSLCDDYGSDFSAIQSCTPSALLYYPVEDDPEFFADYAPLDEVLRYSWAQRRDFLAAFQSNRTRAQTLILHWIESVMKEETQAPETATLSLEYAKLLSEYYRRFSSNINQKIQLDALLLQLRNIS